MKIRPVRLFAVVVCFVFPGISADAGPFKGHPLFSKLIGNWEAKGVFTTPDGGEIPVTETWSGKIDDDGTLAATGKRIINGEEQEFTWVYSYNATTEIYECDYSHTGMDQPLRFEVSVAAASRSITLNASMGERGTVRIESKLSADGKSVEAVIRILDPQGRAAVSGKVEHKRKAGTE